MEGRPLGERDLIEGAKAGDTDAFEQLVRAHQAMALRVAFLVVHDHAGAEDVTQDAFIKAFRALHRFRDGAPFRPWLLRIVRNEALNRSRSRGRAERLTLQVASDPVSGGAAPSPEAEVIARDDARRLATAIDQLPERYRMVVTHRYLLELSEQETAAVLAIPLGTVKSRLARGLDRLLELLDVERDSG